MGGGVESGAVSVLESAIFSLMPEELLPGFVKFVVLSNYINRNVRIYCHKLYEEILNIDWLLIKYFKNQLNETTNVRLLTWRKEMGFF